MMYLVKVFYRYGYEYKVAQDAQHLANILAGVKGKHTRYIKTGRAQSYAPLGYETFELSGLTIHQAVSFDE